MRTTFALAGAMACVMLTSGCSTSLVSNSTPKAGYLVGQAYNLPRAELFVGLDRELKECEAKPRPESVVSLWVQRGMESATKFAARAQRELDRAGQDPAAEDYLTNLAEKLGVPEEILEDLPRLDSGKLRTERVAWVLLNDSAPRDPAFQSNSLSDVVKTALRTQTGDQFNGDLWTQSLNAKLPTSSSYDFRLLVDLRAKVTRQLVSDPDQYYALDYSKTGNGWKKTEYEVFKYPNGTLKSINVLLEDETAAVVSSVAHGALTVALAATGAAPLPAIGAGKEAGGQEFKLQPFEDFLSGAAASLCKPEILQLLELRKGAEKAASDAAAAAASQNPVIESLATASTKAAAEHEAKKAARAALPATDTAGIAAADAEVAKAKKAAEEAVKGLDAAKKLKDGLQKNYLEADAKARDYAGQLSLTSMAHMSPGKHRSPPNGPDLLPISGARAAAAKWLTADGMKLFCGVADNCDDKGVPVRMQAYAQLIGGVEQMIVKNNNGAPQEESGKTGLVYREPGRSILKVCAQTPCLSDGAVSLRGDFEILTEVVEIPQYGVLAMLPFKNGSFQNNTVTAGFTEAGSVANVKYVSNARFANMAKSFEETATVYKTYRDDRRAQPLKDIKAQIEETKALAELSKEQKALADAEKARLDAAAAAGAASTDAPQ